VSTQLTSPQITVITRKLSDSILVSPRAVRLLIVQTTIGYQSVILGVYPHLVRCTTVHDSWFCSCIRSGSLGILVWTI